MPGPLGHKKEELMAQFLARGMTIVDAHAKSGYAKNRGNASAKAKQPNIVARVAELREEYGVIEEQRKETLMTDNDDIDEKWLIGAYRTLHDESKDFQNYKVAKECLDEIGKMMTLGDHNRKVNETKSVEERELLEKQKNTPVLNLQVIQPEQEPEEKDVTPEEEEA